MSVNILNIETMKNYTEYHGGNTGEPRSEFFTASSLHIFSVGCNLSDKKHFLPLNTSLIEDLVPLIFMSRIQGNGIEQNDRVNNRVCY